MAAAARGQQPGHTDDVTAVNTAIARSADVMLMIDHAATPAAASSTCAAPKSPGTASANAAAIGTSALTDNAVASRGERDRVSSAPTP